MIDLFGSVCGSESRVKFFQLRPSQEPTRTRLLLTMGTQDLRRDTSLDSQLDGLDIYSNFPDSKA